MHANGLYADKLAPSKLQTLITFDSGGVTTQSAYAREARSDAVVVSIGRSPIDPTLEVKIVRLARSRAVSDANGTFIGEIRAFSIDLPPQNFSARSVRALDFARQMHGVWERFWRKKKKKKKSRETGKLPKRCGVGVQHEDFPGGHPS
ncbi:hypothetical protein MIMGU_mgv11b013166mg [Erythranthe guttata]|uniref:Uncharacterized protein n=1 Tax=Erythranthe guttata TaxID=4155 RepID=A0A022QND8_ERYGU|nr:hypothetical protein MIMGU_mgv11b013166mg [Erythranthe guttata]